MDVFVGNGPVQAWLPEAGRTYRKHSDRNKFPIYFIYQPYVLMELIILDLQLLLQFTARSAATKHPERHRKERIIGAIVLMDIELIANFATIHELLPLLRGRKP